MRKLIVSLSLLALAACGNPDTPGGRAADARHANFKNLGRRFKIIDDQLHSATPNLTDIRSAAGDMATMAGQLETWFPKGSSKADGMHTEALQAAWDKPVEFKQAAGKLIEQANAFKAVTQSGDMAAMRQGMQAVSAACKGCHDKFREPD